MDGGKVMEQDILMEILQRVTKVEAKIDGYNNLKEKLDATTNRSLNNEKAINELKIEVKDTTEKFDNRVLELEKKPAKRWDEATKTIVTVVITAIATFIMSKIFS